MIKILAGTVVSHKMNKTAVVVVERTIRHPVYKKTITRSKRYKADVAVDMKITEGEMVQMQEVRPISKQKRFKIIKVGKK